jgi:2-aminoadipate transaminase
MNNNKAPYTFQFSKRAQGLTSSVIREILKVTQQPEVISFAGGIPSPLSFPVDAFKASFDRVLTENGSSALQYGPTEGVPALRSWVAASLSTPGDTVSVDEILIVSGSQQGLDLLGKVLIDEGSKVLVESPTYLGAIQSFSLFQPHFVSVATDDDGLIPERIDAAMAKDARLLYTLPNFQNPTGRTLTTARRIALMRRAAEFGLPVVEDDPYGELRYRGDPQPSLYQLGRACGAPVIRLGSFSKVLSPGLRLGYIAAPKQMIAKLVQAKQASDLHTSSISQMVVYDIVKDGFLDGHLPGVRDLYRSQCDAMLSSLDKHFPRTATWTHPEGGMFLWITLPESVDTEALLQHAVSEKVAFVPGAPFYASGARSNAMRLCFVTVTPDQIEVGIRRLAHLIEHAVGATAKAA